MRLKITILLALAGLILPLTVQAYPLGVELYTGYDMPVVQQDVGSGMMYGLAVRGNMWKFLHGELFFRSTSQGDKDEDMEFGNQTETVTYKGGTLSGFGFNLLMGANNPASFWPYFLLGVSSNTLKPGDDFKKKETLTGWKVGFGSGINLYHKTVYLDINTALLVMSFHDNNASRKNWQSRIGIQYFIPIKMGGN
jgi:hypothetical protein